MSNIEPNSKIYDFLYLDFERIRSYSAQIFGGVIDSKTNSSSTTGGITGGVPVISGNINYYKSESETKSLHHKLYLDVENKLNELEKVYFLNEDIIPENTYPFIKFSSEIQILDYTDIGNKISDLFELMQGISSITKNTNQINIGINKKDLRTIVDLIKKLYGETIKINYIRNGQFFTQSTIQPSLIQHGFNGLVTNQQSVLRNNWITFAQIIRKEELSTINSDGLQMNQLDGAIVKMLEAFSGIENLINTQTNFTIIPIAIYREL